MLTLRIMASLSNSQGCSVASNRWVTQGVAVAKLANSVVGTCLNAPLVLNTAIGLAFDSLIYGTILV